MTAMRFVSGVALLCLGPGIALGQAGRPPITLPPPVPMEAPSGPPQPEFPVPSAEDLSGARVPESLVEPEQAALQPVEPVPEAVKPLSSQSPTVLALPGNTLVLSNADIGLSIFFDAGGGFANSFGGGGAWALNASGELCLDYDERGGADTCLGLPDDKVVGDAWVQTIQGEVVQNLQILPGQAGRS